MSETVEEAPGVGSAQREPAEVELRAYLAARMLPLSILLGVLVSLAAPLADYVLTLHGLRAQARTRAEELATVINREASQQPFLWQYNLPKLLTNVQSNQLHNLLLVDRHGRAVELATNVKLEGDLLWESAPIVIDGEPAGRLWIASMGDRALREALLLLIPFGLLGLLLSISVYWIPLRAMTRAESKIRGLLTRLHASQQSLEAFNQTLEQQVSQRSGQLQQANAQLRTKEEYIRSLSARQSSLQEAERRAVARDLHDSTGQALTAIRINLQLIEQMAERREFVATTAAKTMAMTDDTVEEIRRAVASLSPAILDDFGLKVAVTRLCDDFGEQTGIDVSRTIELDAIQCSPAIETAVYRIAQEALTNVKRHAAADHVRVQLVESDQMLVLEIADDGGGVVPEALAKATARPAEQGGRGVHGMRERCELLGGTFEFTSTPGAGSCVRAQLPCESTR